LIEIKIKCIVVEDERVAREGLQSYIEQYDFLELAGCFSNAFDALEFLKNETVSLMFLDIEMPGLKGIEMAKKLDGLLPLIIFTTAYAQYALEGYRVNAIDYLVKPIFPEDFNRSVQKAKNFFGYIEKDTTPESPEKLLIKSEGEWLRIAPEDILFLKSIQNYVIIHLKNVKPRMVLQPLKEICALLPSFFIQTHRSYMVNMTYVKKVSDTAISIQEFVIPLSRSRKKEVTEAFLMIKKK
jgi:DNA-binding LytR/AlgR family response regulator